MNPGHSLAEVLAQEPEVAAPELLGSHLISEVDGDMVRVRITEVEAYKGSDDPASHAFLGRTERNSSMFEAPGTLYVYRSYGIHNCANSAAGPVGTGWGILIRGAEILDGEGVVRRRRGRSDQLTNGPGKLTQALGINLEHNGANLLSAYSPVRLEPGPRPEMVLSTPRVGISKAQDRPWRFVSAALASAMP
jgi:DNA-3-methyladenine glycosylase